MAKYGSPSVGFLLVDGFSLLGSDVLSIMGPDDEAVLERSDGLGKSWEETLATGLRKAAFGHEGFYDDAVGSANDAISEKQQTQRVVCVGPFGNAVGVKFWGLAGAFAGKYTRVRTIGQLHKANADYTVTGAVEQGVVLQELEAKTADWNTEGADSVDNGASSANGGAGYLQVVAYTGFTNVVFKIRHSADDVTYADLITFTTVTAISAQRATVAGTVNRHLAVDGNVTGAGSVTPMVGFSRAA